MQKSGHVTGFYTLIQSLYWITYGLMFNYASLFLLDRGFTNGQIGLVLGTSYALSACIQPLFAAFVGRAGLRLSSAVAGIYVAIALLSASVLVLPLKGLALALVMGGALTLQSSMQPSINSIHRGYELNGVPVNFGLARGMGSAAFAVMIFIMGRLLRTMAPRVLPAFYLSTAVLLLVCLAAFRSPSISGGEEKARSQRREALLKRHPRFGLYLGGVACLALAHIFIDNFMLQIMRNVGGDSANLGVAIAIAGVVELPAMVLYGRMSRRVDGFVLLRTAGWLWAIKTILTLLARSPIAIYGTELLQFCAYAIYVPAGVDYIARTLPREDFLRGQSLGGSAFTLGSLAATMLGGQLLDTVGVNGALVVAVVVSALGAVLLTLCIPRGKARG